MAASTKLKLTLIVDNDMAKVLYAENDKEFVDFLFSILMLNVSSVVRALTKDYRMVGCLPELYSSLESFSPTHWMPSLDKNQILRPIPNSIACQKTLVMLRYDGLPSNAGAGGSGFVKGGEAVYMVTDELVVTPMAAGATVGLLKKVKDPRSLEVRNVELGMEEGLRLITASLSSKSVLSDVFVRAEM